MFRRPIHPFRLRQPPHLHLRKPYSTPPNPQPSTPPPPPQSRLTRLNSRLPKFLHRYTIPLANAPITHITSFLLLHEITAIIPLLGLAATFHYTDYLPPWFSEGAIVKEGVERFGRYFRRKGWIRSGDAEEAEREVSGGDEEARRRLELRKRDKAWGWGEGGVRVVVEFATAYAVTKALLPVRIVFSVWATPWFARSTVVPVGRAVKRLFGWGKGKGKKVDVAKTGAVEGGAVPKGETKGRNGS